jgi:hypothetical protein
VTADGLEKPGIGRVARLFDDLRVDGHLRDPFRHRERNERAAHAEHGRQDQQRLQVQAAAVVRIDVETGHFHDDGQQDHDRKVRRNEKDDSHHGGSLDRSTASCGRRSNQNGYTRSGLEE